MERISCTNNHFYLILDNMGVKDAVVSAYGASVERIVSGEIELRTADKDGLVFIQEEKKEILHSQRKVEMSSVT